MTAGRASTLACVLLAGAARTVLAQPVPPARPEGPPVLSTVPSTPAGAMSEPAQMSGFPLQVGDLPPGIVAVRVIRRNFQENVASQPVLLRVGETGRVLSAVTGQDGRAQFDGLTIGDRVRVRAALGSEVLESQPFDVPSQGGVRLVLVADVGAATASTESWPAPSSSTSLPSVVSGPPLATRNAPAEGALTVARLSVVAGFAAILIVVGVTLQRRQRRRPVVESRPVSRVASSRADTFEELVQLEKDHQARRAALIDRLIKFDG